MSKFVAHGPNNCGKYKAKSQKNTNSLRLNFKGNSSLKCTGDCFFGQHYFMRGFIGGCRQLLIVAGLKPGLQIRAIGACKFEDSK